ncbi:hypothetical protein EON65_50655 [archaeon]|nr:MAG: hypothetical protein EON65_50655 [archaeon]
MDELTCQQLLSSFLIYDQQFMDPFEFLVRAKCILMRGVGDRGESTSRELLRELRNMLPAPLNKIVRLPFAEIREEESSEDMQGGMEEVKESMEAA